eukprot:7208398-Prymnesium_polylepis.1
MPWSRKPRPRRAGARGALMSPAALYGFLRSFGARLVHSHHPHSTLSVTSASMSEMRTLETSR